MLLADTFARVIGATALGVGLIGTVVGLLTYVRDRPHLTLKWTFRLHRDEGVTLVVHVVNDGRQPIAISDVSVQNFRWTARWLTRWRRRLARLLWQVRRFTTHRRVLVLDGWIDRLTEEGSGGEGTQPVEPLTQPRPLRPGDPIEFTFLPRS